MEFIIFRHSGKFYKKSEKLIAVRKISCIFAAEYLSVKTSDCFGILSAITDNYFNPFITAYK